MGARPLPKRRLVEAADFLGVQAHAVLGRSGPVDP